MPKSFSAFAKIVAVTATSIGVLEICIGKPLMPIGGLDAAWLLPVIVGALFSSILSTGIDADDDFDYHKAIIENTYKKRKRTKAKKETSAVYDDDDDIPVTGNCPSFQYNATTVPTAVPTTQPTATPAFPVVTPTATPTTSPEWSANDFIEPPTEVDHDLPDEDGVTWGTEDFVVGSPDEPPTPPSEFDAPDPYDEPIPPVFSGDDSAWDDGDIPWTPEPPSREYPAPDEI